MRRISALFLAALLLVCLMAVASVFASPIQMEDQDDVLMLNDILAEWEDEDLNDEQWLEDVLSFAQSMASTKCVTASALNVRAGRGTNYKIVGSLSMGTKVSVSAVSGGWAQIGAGRFVSNQYLGACGGGGGGGGASPQKGVAASNYARKQVGKCYSQDVNLRRGPKCFDCSGLVNKAWELQGVQIPWTTHGYPSSNMLRISRANVRAGDLLWRSGHVGMYVGNGEVVHAANTRQGVIRGSFSSFSYQQIYRPR